MAQQVKHLHDEIFVKEICLLWLHKQEWQETIDALEQMKNRHHLEKNQFLGGKLF